jgi:shikimate kinase
MKNVYLVGFMGTGKTAVGKELGVRLDKQFVEMDDEIEKRAGKTIVKIFAEDGEAHFRKLEKNLLKELNTKQNLIVSCGGGLICNEENLAILKESGTVINLKSSAEKIYERTKIHAHRPLLNVDDPLQEIKGLMEKRAPFYLQAHYVVESEEQTPAEVASVIESLLREKNHCDG